MVERAKGVGQQLTVMDPRLRVNGVTGLRVVDCSVMPTLVSGNTHAAAVMLAEKAADMVRAAPAHVLPARPAQAGTGEGVPGVVPQGKVVPPTPEPVAPPRQSKAHYLWAVLIARIYTWVLTERIGRLLPTLTPQRPT